jgi:hypothetical protein
VEGIKRWDGDRRERKMKLHQTTKQDKRTETTDDIINHPITSLPFHSSHAQSPIFILSTVLLSAFSLDVTISRPLYPHLFLSPFTQKQGEKKKKKLMSPTPFVTPFGICILTV